MIARYKYHDIEWVDVEEPTHEEVRTLMQEFDIHPIVADEMLLPSLRPKVDHYDNFIYLILHFPALRHTHSRETQEIDFIIGKKFLITVHYEAIDPLHKFSKVFEVNSVLNRSDIGDHAGFVFFYMVRKVYSSLLNDLSAVGDDLRGVEERIFHGKEKEMVVALSNLNRALFSYRRALRLHASVLESLRISSGEFFGKDFVHYIDNIIGEFRKVEESLGDKKDSLEDLRATNDSLLSTKTNEVIKTLTILNAIILPAAFISWVFAIDAEHVPFKGLPYDFWAMVAIMLTASLLTYVVLRWKKLI